MNIIQAILNLFFGGNKKQEVKELDKQIKVKDQEVKELEKEVEVLESKKKVNKKKKKTEDKRTGVNWYGEPYNKSMRRR